MRNAYFPIVAALAATTVAGCSSTGTTTPEPEPFPESVSEELASGLDASSVYSNGTTVERGTGSFQMDEAGNHLTVDIEGTTYAMSISGTSAPVTRPAWETSGNWQGYEFVGALADGAVILGQYSALALMTDSARDIYALQGGLETPADGLPEQTAEYEGGWLVGGDGVSVHFGAFDADADFDGGTIDFVITNDDGTLAMGNGTGTISGSAFNSSYDVSVGSISSTNTVEGNFYGPAAEEMVGLIEGTSGSLETLGYLHGHQK